MYNKISREQITAKYNELLLKRGAALAESGGMQCSGL